MILVGFRGWFFLMRSGTHFFRSELHFFSIRRSSFGVSRFAVSRFFRWARCEYSNSEHFLFLIAQPIRWSLVLGCCKFERPYFDFIFLHPLLRFVRGGAWGGAIFRSIETVALRGFFSDFVDRWLATNVGLPARAGSWPGHSAGPGRSTRLRSPSPAFIGFACHGLAFVSISARERSGPFLFRRSGIWTKCCLQ